MRNRSTARRNSRIQVPPRMREQALALARQSVQDAEWDPELPDLDEWDVEIELDLHGWKYLNQLGLTAQEAKDYIVSADGSFSHLFLQFYPDQTEQGQRGSSSGNEISVYHGRKERDAVETMEHELIHFTQNLLRILFTENAGFARKGERVWDQGRLLDGRTHYLTSSVEYHAWLRDKISDAKRYLIIMGGSDYTPNELFLDFVEHDEFLAALRENRPLAYRKAAKDLYKYVFTRA